MLDDLVTVSFSYFSDIGDAAFDNDTEILSLLDDF